MQKSTPFPRRRHILPDGSRQPYGQAKMPEIFAQRLEDHALCSMSPA